MPDPIQDILAQFHHFDRNADGDPAIASLAYPPLESSLEEIPRSGRLVLVIVESRLLEPLAGAEDLQPTLLRYKGDLRAEGFFSRVIAADVYHGVRNQDGRTLLALRRVLREIKLTYSNLAGVILVGKFPEAPIVRRCVWRVMRDGKPDELLILPGVIATRAEIVLADLDGHWDLVYHEAPQPLEHIRAKPDPTTMATAWPVDGAIFSSSSYSRTFETFRDFFFVDDADYSVQSVEPGSLRLFIRTQPRHPELGALDRGLPNPISRPDIVVSRINAKHVAVNPDPAIRGDDGTPPLDAAGFPQAFTTTRRYDTWLAFFKPDPVFERRLLRDYFDRNHRFRTGAFASLPFRAGAVAAPTFDASDGAAYLAPASPQFGAALTASSATVLDYVRWFKQPAVLRYIVAHSGGFSSHFGAHYHPMRLEQEVGGRPFRWRLTGDTYTPSLQDQGIHADFYVHRSLWQNGVLHATGANLVVHGGCSVNEPANWEDPSSGAEYGSSFQNAEGLLFYMNGVMLIARAKDYNDRPDGFPGALAVAPRANAGDAWRAYFDHDAATARPLYIDDPFTAKKTYFWSMIGDWSVRLRYRGGVGVLGLDHTLRALQVHADRAWIDGWNFDTNASTIRGVGDIDGDGTSEFVVTSSWGLGILKHDGNRWRQVLVAPNGTRFDGWLLNTANDCVTAVADFNGDGRAEILVTSAWGIGVLGLEGGTLHAITMAANGTGLGAWRLDTVGDRFGPIADFDADGRTELLVTSAWGMAILALGDGSLRPLVMAANGSRFGGWLLNTANDHFGPAGDMDGNGQDEMLISSAWGIAVLAIVDGTLCPIVMAASGTGLGEWRLDGASDRFGPVADFDGDGCAEMLVASGWGIGVLDLTENTLHAGAMARNGTRVGEWVLDTANDRFGPAADLDGDGHAEMLVTSAWGVGVLAIRENALHSLTTVANGMGVGDWIWEHGDCLVDVWPSPGPTAKYELLVQKGSPCALPARSPVPVRPTRPRMRRLDPALVSFALE